MWRSSPAEFRYWPHTRAPSRPAAYLNEHQDADATKAFPPTAAVKFDGQTLMERTGRPKEIAPAFVFLAAPSCSSYITVEILPIIGSQSGG